MGFGECWHRAEATVIMRGAPAGWDGRGDSGTECGHVGAGGCDRSLVTSSPTFPGDKIEDEDENEDEDDYETAVSNAAVASEAA
jgi:hypothetical protein